MSARSPYRHREHQQRADRLEARFDPLHPNVPNGGNGNANGSNNGGGVASPSPPAANRPLVATSPAAAAPPAPPAATSASAAAKTDAPAPQDTTNTFLQVKPTSNTAVSTAVVVVPPTSSTPSTTSSSTSTSTSALVRPSSVVQATPVVATTQSTTSFLPVFSSVPAGTFATASTMSVSNGTSSSSITSSSGMSSGTIAGVAAGSLAGIAVLGIVGYLLIKRYTQSRDADDSDAAPFSRHSWMRNSVVLPDEPPVGPRVRPSPTPRPPSMIERKQANLAGRGHGFQGYGPGGYAQSQPVYDPAPGGGGYGPYPNQQYGRPPMEYAAAGGHPFVPYPHQQPSPFSPIASPPLHPPSPSTIDHTAPPVSYNNIAAAPAYFTRHNSMISEKASQRGESVLPNPYAASPQEGGGYATLDRSSVTAYQAKQYAEISRQLEGGGGAVASPFEDPAMARRMSPPAAAVPAGFVVPPPISIPAPSSPKPPSFRAVPMSPSFVTVPTDMHAGRETPVQFGFADPAAAAAMATAATAEGISPPPAAVVKSTPTTTPNPNRMSMASMRPETMYNEEDAYGGI